MDRDFFPDVTGKIPFGGLESTNPLAYRVYEPDRLVMGKRMEDHLRIAVCLWHSFNWPGSDVFGVGTFDRPWLDPGLDPMTAARAKVDAAFEFLAKLGVPFFCFHDRDVAPEGRTFAETQSNLATIVDLIEGHMSRTGLRLLWGTANLFSHPRYAAGAATNPDPDVFAFAAAQVKLMLDATKRLGGANYVLWGGREGYETLLNTDLGREGRQLARFLSLVADYKHKIGFTGLLLIEPKPQEPTKHQYDYDTATVHGFLVRHGLDGEYRVNIEANHATLAGHSFHHEVAYAVANGIFGSIDANRGDYQNGWDTDQFPNSVEELSLALYEILRGGGFTTGGFNFDAKLRRQSMDRTDLFHGHIGGIDTLALSLLVAADMLTDGTLDRLREERYAGWAGPLGIDDPGRGRRHLAGRARKHASRPARSIRVRAPAARSCSRTWSTAISGPPNLGESRRPSADRHARRPRHRRLHDRDQGRPRRRGRGRRGDRGRGIRRLAAAPTLERAGPRRSGGTRRAAPSGLPWRPPVCRAWTWPRWGSRDRCTASCCSTRTAQVLRPAILWNDQRTAAECDLIRRVIGPERLIRITGNDALTGFTAPKLVWVRDHEPDTWRRIAHVLLPKDFVRHRLTGDFAVDKADGAGTILFDLAARSWSDEMLSALEIDRAWLPRDVRRAGRHGRRHARPPPQPPGSAPGRRSSPAAVTRRPTPSASGRPTKASSRCRWGRRASSSPRPERRRTTSGAGSTPSATPSRAAGT